MNNRISFYELLIVLTVMGFANYYNKVRFIFNLFDFDSTHDLNIDQLNLLVT